MKDIDRVLELRKNMMEDWRYRGMHWRDITYKYRVSKEWFYKLRKRYIEKGLDGLKDKIRDNSNRPRRIGLEEKIRILDYIYESPTHGVTRIGWEFIPHISHRTLWKFLKKEDLNTRHKRRLWAESQGKRVLTKKEKPIRSAKHNHVESHAPGELVSIDTLTVSVKGLGKIWNYTACDTYSSYSWIKAYRYKTSDNAVDFFMNHILPAMPMSKIKRVLTDQGTEFYNFKNKENDSPFTNALRAHNIKHTVTKVAHPWTNGYVERLNQTIWQEFYLCRLTNPYASVVRGITLGQ